MQQAKCAFGAHQFIVLGDAQSFEQSRQEGVQQYNPCTVDVDTFAKVKMGGDGFRWLPKRRFCGSGFHCVRNSHSVLRMLVLTLDLWPAYFDLLKQFRVLLPCDGW